MEHEEPRATASQAVARPRTERGLLVAALSLLIPGAGQLAVGARRRGLVMLAITMLLLVAAWHGVRGPGSALEVLVRPGGLAELLVGNIALALFRIYATLDAFRLGSGGLGRAMSEQATSLGSLGAVAVLATVALAPHALAAHYLLVADGMLREVFAGPQTSERTDVSGGEGPNVAGRSFNADTASDDGGSPVDRAVWLEQDRLTLAVLGSDAAPARPGHRLDAMVVVSVQPATGQVAIFSVERHLRHFPLPNGLQTAWEQRCRDAAPGWDLLNGLYRCGDEVLTHEVAQLFPDAPDPAAAAVADTLGIILGLPVDHYVMVDMAGFVELVDALGGIRLELPGPWSAEHHAPSAGCDWTSFDVTPTSRHLDGPAALELVRNRTGTNEADRMARQRCLLVTLAGQADTSTLLRQFEPLADVMRRHVVTSIPLDDVPALIDLLGDLDLDDAVTVGFGQPEHIHADVSPHLERIRSDVEATLGGASGPTAQQPAVR